MLKNKKDDFLPCPMCGRKPKRHIFSVNSGVVYCKGRFLNKHRIIMVVSEFSNASKLYEILVDKWNIRVVKANMLKSGMFKIIEMDK